MNTEIEEYVRNYGRCFAKKMLQITSSGPLDLVKFLSIEPDSKAIANVLAITDHFTRHAQAFLCRDLLSQDCSKYFG